MHTNTKKAHKNVCTQLRCHAQTMMETHLTNKSLDAQQKLM